MAAVEADRVVVAIIGDTSKLDAPVEQSARKFDKNMSDIEKSATRAERQIVRSSGAIQNAQRNLGRQIADIGTQVAGGQSPFLILAQQLPQVADAATDMGGKFGKVAAFLTTPWGAAALAATSVLVPLAAGLIKTGNETDELVEKMRKQARQSELSEQAQRQFANTLEGVTAAIRDNKKALDDLANADQTAAERANAAAKANLDKALSIRTATAAAAKAAEEELRRANSSAESGLAGSGAAEKLGAAREAARKAEEEVRKAQAQLDRSRGFLAAEQAERAATAAATAEGRITSEYERQKKLLEDKAAAEIAATSELRKQQSIANRLGADLLKLQKARDRSLRDSRTSNRSDADTTQFLRPVSGGTIRGRLGEQRPGHAHAGVDIAVPVGTQVRAAAAGTVIESGTLPGYGNVVIIDHGRGTVTRYAHLSQLGVRKGDVVGAGEAIGLSGGARGAAGSGNSQGPHLHYEVRRGGKPVDPFGAYPIDPATARKVSDNVQDDFDALWDDIQRGADQARDKIASDFKSLETALDPAAAAANRLAERLEVIEKARLTGIIDDARAAQVAFLSLSDAMGPLFSVAGASKDAGGELGKTVGDGVTRGFEEATERQRDQILTLADYYEAAFSGGTKSVWEMFKREAFRSLALIAAQATFKAITGKEGPSFGGGGLFGGGSSIVAGDDPLANLFKGVFGGIFGRASGGYVGPGSITRVNEGRGGVELLRMGSQGGTVIPLGQTRAASPAPRAGNTYHISVSADNSVTPAGFARGLAAEILREANKMDATRQQGTLRAVPGRVAQYQNDGT